MPKLTKRLVDAAGSRATEHFIWDDELPGFGLRVLPSGRKGYVVQYRAGRRSRRVSLGSSNVVPCEQARTRAMTIMVAVRNGDDFAGKAYSRMHGDRAKRGAEGAPDLLDAVRLALTA
jgi:Arm DNA-binding domain